MVSYNCALDIDTAFLAGHHRRPRTASVAWVACHCVQLTTRGRVGQLLRPVRATETPTPIMARPPAPPTSSNRRGERANQDRSLLAASPQVLSETSPIMIDTRLSSSICSGTS